MGAFAEVVRTMAGMDVFQLFFPWLLMLAVTYGVLEKYGIFSDDSGVNGAIALAVAFFATGGAFFFLPEGILSSFAAGLTFSVFGILGLMILLALAGVNLEEEMNREELPAIGALVLAILTFLGAFVFQADLGAMLGNVQNAFQDVVMPILILVFLIIVVALTAGGGGGE